jgi:cyclohexanecarboxylate-CoA ligase
MTTHDERRAALARAMRAGGFWTDQVIDVLLGRAVARSPGKTAVVAHRAEREGSRRFSYRELEALVARAAGGLRALGVGRGDVVSIQLPNWWEFVVATLACGRLGAVVNPLMPIFRERELLYMLRFCEAKVFIVPKVYRGHDHAAMAQGMRAQLPALRRIVIVDDDGPDGFERVLLRHDHVVPAPEDIASAALRPDDLAVMMFTSGTTGEPKGVMHSSNTLIACLNSLAGRLGLTEDDVLLVGSPVGHMMGFAAHVMLSLRLGATMVLQDVWEARRAMALMGSEDVTFSGGATPFLTDVCEAVVAGVPRPQRLRLYLCAGAPIPPVLVERARRELGLTVCSLWGMTEALSGTLTEPERAADKSSSTDGRPLEGMEVKVVDEEGRSLPTGETGRVLVRGAQVLLGYFRRPDLPTTDAEGWFDSGDLAYLDAEGYIRINGRSKDVVIRAGENVPVVEIENILLQHPAVGAVAIVGFPDRRLGERACAFIVLREGTRETLDLPKVQAFLAERRVAKPYWPERVELLEELPRTPTGKTQKFVLRQRAKAFGDPA